MGFDQEPLFFDHDDEIETLGEVFQDLRIERPDHADFEEPQADLGGHRLVDAELFERLPDIEIAFAGGDDADPGMGAAAQDDLVQLVGPGEGDGGEALVSVESLLLLQAVVIGADVEAAGRQFEVRGDDGLDAVEARFDDGGRFHRVMHAFDADPAAGEARQGIAMEAVIEEFLEASRVQHRHHGIEEGEFRLVGDGGGFRPMIVAGHDQHAAVFRGAGGIGMAEHIARAVDAGAFAIPHAEHPIEGPFAAHFGLLGAPEGGGGQILIEAGLEFDVSGLEERGGLPEGLVDAADGGAAIARDIGRGVEPRLLIKRFLHQHEAHHGLGAGDIDRGFA